MLLIKRIHPNYPEKGNPYVDVYMNWGRKHVGYVISFNKRVMSRFSLYYRKNCDIEWTKLYEQGQKG